MINAKNTLVLERIRIVRVGGLFVFQPPIQTGQRDLPSLRCTMSVCLQFHRNRICTSQFYLRDVTDDLPRSMMIEGKHHHEGFIWINRVASEFVFQPLHRDTGALLHDERVIAVREEPISIENSTSELSLLDCGHFGNFLLRSR